MFGADAIPIISFSPPYLASDTRLVKAVFCKSRFLNKILPENPIEQSSKARTALSVLYSV